MNRFQQCPEDSFSLAIDVADRTMSTCFTSSHKDQVNPASSSRFQLCMQSVEGRESFTAFLQTEYAEENMAFYIAAEEMSYLTDDAAVRRAYESLHTAFILKSSKQSINISDKLFERLDCLNDTGVEGHHLKKDEIMHVRLAIIAEVQLEISHLLEYGSFPRFERSNSFKFLLPKLQDSAKTQPSTSTRAPSMQSSATPSTTTTTSTTTITEEIAGAYSPQARRLQTTTTTTTSTITITGEIAGDYSPQESRLQTTSTLLEKISSSPRHELR
jgi:hypothetical protein